MLEADRFAIHQDQLDFGMRHAECLDHVLRRGVARADATERTAAQRPRDKVVQLFVKPECRRDHRTSIAPRAVVCCYARVARLWSTSVSFRTEEVQHGHRIYRARR